MVRGVDVNVFAVERYRKRYDLYLRGSEIRPFPKRPNQWTMGLRESITAQNLLSLRFVVKKMRTVGGCASRTRKPRSPPAPTYPFPLPRAMASAADEGNAAAPRAAVSHVIFDMDGLLLGLSLSSDDSVSYAHSMVSFFAFLVAPIWMELGDDGWIG